MGSDGPSPNPQVLCQCYQCYAHTSVEKDSGDLVNGEYVDEQTYADHQQRQDSLGFVPPLAPDKMVSSVYFTLITRPN